MVPSPQKCRKLHTIFRIHHIVDDFVVIQNGFGDIQPQAAAAAVPVPGFVQGGHPLCHIADTNQWLGVVPGTNHRPHDGDQQNHNGDKGGLFYKWCLFYR